MAEIFLARYAYVLVLVLMVIGLYAALVKRNLVKKMIGLNIFQTAIFFFYVEGAAKLGGTVPVIDPTIGSNPADYINPLPHVLMLTGIVVSISVTGVALAMLINIRRNFHSLEEDDIMKEMSK